MLPSSSTSREEKDDDDLHLNAIDCKYFVYMSASTRPTVRHKIHKIACANAQSGKHMLYVVRCTYLCGTISCSDFVHLLILGIRLTQVCMMRIQGIR